MGARLLGQPGNFSTWWEIQCLKQVISIVAEVPRVGVGRIYGTITVEARL